MMLYRSLRGNAELLDLLLYRQRIYFRFLTIIGIPLLGYFTVLDLGLRRHMVAAMCLVMLGAILSIGIVNRLKVGRFPRYVATQSALVVFLLAWGALVLYMVFIENNFSRIPWIVVFPMAAIYVLGFAESIPLTLVYLSGVAVGILRLNLNTVSVSMIEGFLLRFLLNMAILVVMIYGSIYVLNRDQRRLVRSNWLLKESEERYRKANEDLRREIEERAAVENRLRDSLQENQLLVKEIHHRVKNNMQIISSILNLESFKIGDSAVRNLFDNCQKRIQAMSMVHERLYKSERIANIEIGAYVKDLVASIHDSYRNVSGTVEIRASLDTASIDLNTAIPLGLIINEIVTNSLKYAFEGRDRGTLDIAFRRDAGGGHEFIIADDGKGIPDEYASTETKSLGLTLIRTLMTQMRGTMELEVNGGTRYTLRFGRDSSFRVVD